MIADFVSDKTIVCEEQSSRDRCTRWDTLLATRRSFVKNRAPVIAALDEILC